MPSAYNRVAGQNLDRLCALSDGVFAVAMTLLVLDVRAPGIEGIHNERDLLQALVPLAPRLLMYLMSFLTLGIFWVGQQTQQNYFIRTNRHLAWLHLAFLFAVCLLPFSTSLLAQFIRYRTALLLYWANILVLGALLYISWRYADRAGLLRDDTPVDDVKAICRRIVIAQTLYALGAALCIFKTYWSIGFIVLLQLNYAIAPSTRHKREE